MEIRTYEGDGEDVAELIAKVWPTTYGGKTWVPVWDLATLRWQILSPRSDEARDYLLAAYEGTRLAGCLFADPRDFRVHGNPVRGSLLSWFTIDPEAGSPMLAVQMVREMLSRHATHEAAFSLGYVMGKKTSPAYRFWNRYSELFPNELRFLKKMGYWVRVLNPSAVSRAGLSPIERCGAPWLRWWQPTWPRTPTHLSIRDFRHTDLMDGLPLVNYRSRPVDLCLDWSAERLGHQLEASDVSTTLVCETPRGINGVLNFHQLTLFGRAPLPCALMDILVGPSSLAESSALLRAGLERMRALGLHAAVLLRTANCPVGALLANGFLPLPAQDHLVGLFPSSDCLFPPPRRISLPLR